ncbi:MAG: hypothetical protein KDH92_04085 [Chloroflexi bacterium]|nr:hypothetical protein [Chloroflexota bacterium]
MSQHRSDSAGSARSGPRFRGDASIDCASARARLLTGDPAAAEHLARCPVCRERLDQLSVAVLSASQDAIPCAECRAWLPQLIAGGREGAALATDPAAQERAAALGRAWTHLDRCPECHAEWLAASAVMAELGRPDLPQPPRVPAIDTRFLRPARGRSLPPLRAAAALALLALGLGTGAVYLKGRGAARAPEPDRLADTLATLAPPTGAADEPKAPTEDPLVEALAGRAAERATRRAERTPAAVAGPTGPSRTRKADDRGAIALARPGPNAVPATPSIGPAVAGETATLPASASPGGPSGSAGDPDPDPDATRRPPEASPTPTPEMGTLCMIEGYGPVDAYLAATCDRFPASSAYDVYQLTVREPSRWTFSLCARAQLDTILALYPEGGFDPSAPCRGLVAYNDDYCGRQSRLSLDLAPGTYQLVLAEKTGDLSDFYAIRVGRSLAGGPGACPSHWSPSPTPIASSSPTPSPAPSATATPQAAVSATARSTASAGETPTPTPTPSPSLLPPTSTLGPGASSTPTPSTTPATIPSTPTVAATAPLSPTPAAVRRGPTASPPSAASSSRGGPLSARRPGRGAGR